jgi:hypothetical protein
VILLTAISLGQQPKNERNWIAIVGVENIVVYVVVMDIGLGLMDRKFLFIREDKMKS